MSVTTDPRPRKLLSGNQLIKPFRSVDAGGLGKTEVVKDRNHSANQNLLEPVEEDDAYSKQSHRSKYSRAESHQSRNSVYFEPMVKKIFTKVERFKAEVGGREKMFAYLEEYAKEWKSGKLFGKTKDRPE